MTKLQLQLQIQLQSRIQTRRTRTRTRCQKARRPEVRSLGEYSNKLQEDEMSQELPGTRKPCVPKRLFILQLTIYCKARCRVDCRRHHALRTFLVLGVELARCRKVTDEPSMATTLQHYHALPH